MSEEHYYHEFWLNHIDVNIIERNGGGGGGGGSKWLLHKSQNYLY